MARISRNLVLPLGVLFAAVCALLLVWQTSRWVYQGTLDGLIASGNDRMTLYTGTLRSALDHYSYLPYVLSTNQLVLGLLQGSQPAADVSVALEHLNREAGCEALYVMNDLGTTLASSNWRDPLSFVGQNYGFRPYFSRSKSGEQGRYFAIGATTGQPGFFMSHPVWQGDRIIGVAAVKVDLTDLQDEWREGGETVLVSDTNGVFFLSSYHNWRYRTLEPLTEAQRILIQATRQYGRQPHYLLPLATAQERARAVLVIGVVLSLLVVALAMYLRERRQKLISRRKAREAVVLVEMNKRLQNEIDEHNQTEKALREAQAELVQSSKLAALGHMAAGIVHELNQPIAAIRTHAASGRLLLERKETDKLQTTLTAITRMTEHLGSITVQLKTFARKSPMVRESIVLQECLDDALTMTAALINEAGVTLSTDLPDTPAMIHGNRGRINQVLVNLLRNAVDAVRTQQNKTIQISLTADHHQVALSISDSGTGIRDQDMEEIFTPFYTTKEVGEGLGLGLSISYRIITDLGGSIRVMNNEGGGATFIVCLPGGSVMGENDDQ